MVHSPLLKNVFNEKEKKLIYASSCSGCIPSCDSLKLQTNTKMLHKPVMKQLFQVYFKDMFNKKVNEPIPSVRRTVTIL